MCLDYVINNKNPKQIKFAYKVFEKNNNNTYRGMYYGRKDYFLDIWYMSTDDLLNDSHGNDYKSGFHCYLNKKDAFDLAEKYHVIFKVEVKNITCIGKQRFFNEGNTIVCDQIKLIKEITK